MSTYDAKDFLQAKDHALASLATACNANEVDDDILPVLTRLNHHPEYYSLSSCSGRILLLQIPHLGDKRHAEFLGRWHHQITIQDITTATTKATTGVLWLIGQPPILHVGTETLQAAETLIKAGNAAGFKNSAIRSLGKRIIIELASTERLDIPLGHDGTLYCSDPYLNLLVDLGNEIILRSKEKLTRLCTVLENLQQQLRP
jgi:tRNA wybutosine-synthesizing protein 3